MKGLDINGMVTIEDVTNMIKDTIDRGDLESAKDFLEQLKEYLTQSETVEGNNPFLADALDHHQIMKKGVVR